MTRIRAELQTDCGSNLLKIERGWPVAPVNVDLCRLESFWLVTLPELGFKLL